VKLLDFGLAKVFDSDVDATRTIDNAVLGTAAYMSPEQADGRPTDARSDIFSFGAVLHELLSGRRVFSGATTMQTLAAVMRDTPPQLDAPAAVREIVRRCLEKRPEHRFQTVTELKMALERTAQNLAPPPTSTDATPSVAVLPFADMSPGKDQEWFSDGLTEEIINALVQVPGLRVIARTSAFAFKGKHRDIRRIGEALGVEHLLEGSVRRAGDRVRITAQLIASMDGSHLWSDRYDRDIADVFAIQDDVARSIAATLAVKLSTDPASRRRHVPNIDAYESYLREAHEVNSIGLSSLEKLMEYIDRAMTLDPAFAAPYALLGQIQWYTALTSRSPAHEMAPKAKASLLKAVELDPELPESYAALGWIALVYDFDRFKADQLIRTAVSHQPMESRTAAAYANFLVVCGRADEAVHPLRLALLRDPLSAVGHHMLAYTLDVSGAHDEADTLYRRAIELSKGSFIIREGLAINQLYQDRLADALAAAEEGYAIAPWNSSTAGIVAGLRKRSGDLAGATALVEQLGADERYGAPIGLAIYHALCDEADRSAVWLEKAIAQRDPRIFVFLHLPPGKVWQASSRWPAIANTLGLTDVPSRR
jgi:serine/threonine-protein kinase